ncbi:hypothetical protein O6H91_01G107500 [Diphasiastrum complanatum]|nr:hypothetical protein O6H91_01G107500 [Diphasiastrum complanatum]
MLPSAGMFRDDIQPQMKELLSLLDKNQAPFTINIYPYLSLQQNPNFPKDFAFFDGSTHAVVDGSHVYNNVLDAIYDLLVAALNRTGFPNMPIFVGEIGWPTDGDLNANVASAQKFNQELLKHVLSNIGTPLRPGGPLEVYLFALMDEDQKSVAPGNFEPHWGIFTFDGQPKYPLDLTGQGRNVSLTKASDVRYLPLRWCVLNPDGDMSKLAENVAYACTHADCTPLTYGSSCNSMGVPGNASYAFNRYYQLTNQAGNSCYFEGLGMVTSVDPSTGSCRFLIELALSSAPFRPPASLTIPFAGVIALLFLWI